MSVPQNNLAQLHKIDTDSFEEFINNFSFPLFKYIARKSMIFIVIMLFLCITIPFLYIRYTDKIYRTTATIFKKKADDKNVIQIGGQNLMQEESSKLYKDMLLMKSDVVLDSILAGLPQDYSFKIVGRTNKEAEVLSNLAVFNQITLFENLDYVNFEFDFDDQSYALHYQHKGKTYAYSNLRYENLFRDVNLSFSFNPFVIQQIKAQKNVVANFNSIQVIKAFLLQYVEIYVNDANAPKLDFIIKSSFPAKAERYLGMLIEGFLRFDKEQNDEKINKSLAFIESQVITFNQSYEQNLNEIVNFQVSNQLFMPSGQTADEYSVFKGLDGKIKETQLEITKLHLLQQAVRNSSIEALQIEGLNTQSIVELIKQKNKFQNYYSPENPKIFQINKQINQEVKNIELSILQKINQNQNLISRAAAQKSESNQKLAQLPKQNANYLKLEKELNIKEKFLFDLMDKQNQLLIEKASMSPNYYVLQKAVSNYTPISPKVNMIYFFGLLAFIFSSISIVLFRYVRFDKVITVESVKKRTSFPIIGVVPFMPEAIDNKSNSPLSKIVVFDNKSRITEAIKKIRSSLSYTIHKDFKTICITSTISGEGKTFVLLNLAATFSQLNNKKIILLDLDMRKPRIAKSLKLNDKEGISNILAGQIDYKNCVQELEGNPNFHVLTSGRPIPPNPSELILSQSFKDLLEQLKSDYDYVFIDTPPIGLVNESIEIINMVDIPLYV
ncbi:MAG: polysaccharide biosynthesis tyrosine autokinase, partial [Chitinophagales bacterium]|nr:polysaccharide biosynthesis tyrosine autokinase [Chitinophagales bacterium]